MSMRVDFIVLVPVVFVLLTVLFPSQMLRNYPYFFSALGLGVASLSLLGIGGYIGPVLVLAGFVGFCAGIAFLADVMGRADLGRGPLPVRWSYHEIDTTP